MLIQTPGPRKSRGKAGHRVTIGWQHGSRIFRGSRCFFFDFAGGFGGDFFWTDFSFVTELMNEITARKTVVNDSC